MREIFTEKSLRDDALQAKKYKVISYYVRITNENSMIYDGDIRI